MLAGLEVVLGSTVKGGGGSPTGWAKTTFSSYLTTFVYLTIPHSTDFQFRLNVYVMCTRALQLLVCNSFDITK